MASTYQLTENAKFYASICVKQCISIAVIKMYSIAPHTV